jgi:hypothetical protein
MDLNLDIILCISLCGLKLHLFILILVVIYFNFEFINIYYNLFNLKKN